MGADFATWRLVQLAGAADNVLSWVANLTPGFEPPTHLRALADAFARASAEGGVRACFSAPPRFGKTELAAAALIRHMHLHPDHTCCFVGYSAELAETKSRRIRDLAESSGLRIRSDARRLGAWQLEGHQGGLLAVGLGGPLVGMGVDGVMFVDDLSKTRDDAESPALRASIEAWFTGSALTRIQGNGSVIVCSARWTSVDLIGTLSKGAA